MRKEGWQAAGGKGGGRGERKGGKGKFKKVGGKMKEKENMEEELTERK